MKAAALTLTFFILLVMTNINMALAKEPTPETLAAGKEVFTKNCVICHGDTGAGDGVAGKALNPHPRNFRKDPFKAGTTVDAIMNTVKNGLKGTAMAGFPSLKPEELKAVAYYVLKLRSGK